MNSFQYFIFNLFLKQLIKNMKNCDNQMSVLNFSHYLVLMDNETFYKYEKLLNEEYVRENYKKLIKG